MSGRRSLNARLLAGAALWIAVALICAGVTLDAMFRSHVTAALEARLAADLNQIVAALELDAGGAPALTRRPAEPLFEKPYSGRYFQVSTPAGPPLRSRSLWDAALDLPADELPDGAVHTHRIAGPAHQRLLALERNVRLPDGPASLRVAAAADLDELAPPLRRFRRTLAGALGVLGIGLVGAVLLQVGYGLLPLVRLRRALGDLRAGRRTRLAGDWPAEIRPLVHDFDAVLQHSEAVLERARTQAGNLAHALKTPIAILGNAADAPGPALATTVRAQAAEMRRQIDRHLARARAAANAGRPGAHADALACARQVARTVQKLYAERGIAVAVVDGGAPAFRGDAGDLAEILGNIVENACQWARSRVELRLGAAAGALEILVDDDGPGLPPERREEVFQRGRRLDEAVPGSGLGLAIVRDLVELDGGTIALEPAPLGGLRVRLALPAVAPAARAA
jgi:signal transduction histidine kinase